MYKGKTVGVVVPAYNEEGFVGDVIDTVPEFVDRVYVVDDQSTDGTWAEIQEHARRANRSREVVVADGGKAFDRRVVPIRHDENRGVGGAIKTGYQYAQADRIDATAVMAGDGQMDPDLLDRIVDPVVEGVADYAKGDRLGHPDYREGMSRWRSFGNSLLTCLTKIASGYWHVRDPQNGYTAISLRALDTVPIEDAFEPYGFANDLLVRLNVHRMRVTDVAMPARYGEETSHISYASFIPTVSWLLLKDFLWRLEAKYLVYDFHPLVLLYALGAASTGAGLVAFCYVLWAAVQGRATFGQAMDATLLGALGTITLVLGMLADRAANEDLAPRSGRRRDRPRRGENA